MKIKQTPEQLRDFALYGMKSLHDVGLRAVEKGDVSTTQRVLTELTDLFNRFLKQPNRDRLEVLQVRLDAEPPGPDRVALQERHDEEKKRKAVADAIQTGKDQVIFGLASRALELALKGKEGAQQEQKVEIARILLGKLPASLQKLTEVFESSTDRKVPEFWGWTWWDVVPDGRVHAVDNTTRPNRLYVVRALQLLCRLPPNVPNPPSVSISEDSIDQFSEGNGTSVLLALRSIVNHPDSYLPFLSYEDIQRANDLAALFSAARERSEESREQRLAASPLSEQMVRAFKESVVEAVAEADRFRPIFKAYGAFSDRTNERAPEGTRSWGYNQIDEKGAFIEKWYVSYSSWGETYGRGIAQGADFAAFDAMVKASRKMPAVSKGNVIPTIEKYLRDAAYRDPVIFQSLLTTFEYDEIRRRDLFIASWRDDCPKTPLTGLSGFIGVLKVAGKDVPVVDVFSQEKSLRNRVLVAEVERLIHWTQYNPARTAEEDYLVQSGILIRVIDLNADDAARVRLIAESPNWLQAKGDIVAQAHFLRTHVIVNVFHRMLLDIRDATAGLSFAVRRTRDDLEDA